MLEAGKKFDVPLRNYSQHISKDLRIELFKGIVDGYKREYTACKVTVAFLNWDMQYDFDYLIIMEAENTQGVPFMLYMVPFFGDRHTVQGFYYCLTHDLTKEYFEDTFLALVPIERNGFYNVILELGLSQDKDADNYWKSQKNLSIVAKRLNDLAIRYKPQINQRQ